MKTSPNIYLVGFMGTGKSTIGKELARLMGRKFIDTDQEIEKKLGISIQDIFARYGEPYFRKEEKKLAQELASDNNKVIATGGGTILDPDIFEWFEQSGILICLYTDQNKLLNRLTRIDKRPLLKDDDRSLSDKVEELMRQRQSVYSKVKLRLNTTNLTPLMAARKIHTLIKGYGKNLSDLRDQTLEL